MFCSKTNHVFSVQNDNKPEYTFSKIVREQLANELSLKTTLVNFYNSLYFVDRMIIYVQNDIPFKYQQHKKWVLCIDKVIFTENISGVRKDPTWSLTYVKYVGRLRVKLLAELVIKN